MKKHAIDNYYNDLEFTLLDSSKNNSKLYWKLLKKMFLMLNRPLKYLHYNIPTITVNHLGLLKL